MTTIAGARSRQRRARRERATHRDDAIRSTRQPQRTEPHVHNRNDL